MSLRRETFVCVNCGLEKRANYSSGGIYCSNKCQMEHKNKKLDELFINGDSTAYQTNQTLRRALTRIFGHKCAVCGINEWNGQSIVLELEHKDGNCYNNHIDNLCLICPNCHSQTATYKNKGGRKSVREYRRKSA